MNIFVGAATVLFNLIIKQMCASKTTRRENILSVYNHSFPIFQNVSANKAWLPFLFCFSVSYFYNTSTRVGYLTPNHVCTHTRDIIHIRVVWRYPFLNESELICLHTVSRIKILSYIPIWFIDGTLTSAITQSQWKGTWHSRKLLNWCLTIRWFSGIYRTFVW